MALKSWRIWNTCADQHLFQSASDSRNGSICCFQCSRGCLRPIHSEPNILGSKPDGGPDTSKSIPRSWTRKDSDCKVGPRRCHEILLLEFRFGTGCRNSLSRLAIDSKQSKHVLILHNARQVNAFRRYGNEHSEVSNQHYCSSPSNCARNKLH